MKISYQLPVTSYQKTVTSYQLRKRFLDGGHWSLITDNCFNKSVDAGDRAD